MESKPQAERTDEPPERTRKGRVIDASAHLGRTLREELHGKVLVISEGSRLECRVGVMPRDLALVLLDEGLRARALLAKPSRRAEDLRPVLVQVIQALGEHPITLETEATPEVLAKVTPEILGAARDYVDALRRSHALSRGENSRAECFYRLALALGIPVESDEATPARALVRILKRAKLRVQPPK